MTSLRRRVGDVFVTATLDDSGEWVIATTDAFFRPVDETARRAALEAILKEVSKLRNHLWVVELGNKIPSR